MFNFPVVRKNRVENLLDDFFATPIRLNLEGFDASPVIDIYEKDNKITVKAEIPGVKAEELNVSVDNELLTISGEKKQENEVKERDYYRLETAYGRFERRVQLPQTIKAETAKATYKNGVLKIELTKAEETKKQRIKIDVN